MIHLLIIVLACSRGLALDTYNKGCLSSHNYYREKHGSPALAWSPELASDAQKWADKLASEGKFEHDYETIKKKQQGENMAYFSPPLPKCQGPKHDGCVECGEIVADWYNEVTDYDFNTGKGKTPSSVVLHFTQVDWKNTTELGVGTAVSQKTNRFITVARYKPRGNFGGPEEFKKNLLLQGTVINPTTISTLSTNSSTNPTSTPSKNNSASPSSTPSTNSSASPPSTPPTKISRNFGSTPPTGSLNASKLPSGVITGPNLMPVKDALVLTNFYRSLHHASAITLNRKLSVDAQRWAERLARERKLFHEETSKDGENLAKMPSGDKSFLKAINAWYDEAEDYNFQDANFGANTGHFTQLVWNSTKELGLGMAKTKDGRETYVVARYRPAGNIIGHFKQNVTPKGTPL